MIGPNANDQFNFKKLSAKTVKSESEILADFNLMSWRQEAEVWLVLKCDWDQDGVGILLYDYCYSYYFYCYNYDY